MIAKAKVDTEKIQVFMLRKRHTNRFMADFLGLSEVGWRLKRDGKTQFTAVELKAIADLYGIKVDDLYVRAS